ncbi:MAG: serine dehydratase beta chain, partial [Halomonas sp.]|nr:serine dehydratase beta chain [Halomonas sp.]
MAISVFDLFKIGIGPSSSHTVGPMQAAYDFVQVLKRQELLERVARIEVHLHGSLSATGKGHGTDRAIIMGLMGERPQFIDPAIVSPCIEELLESQALMLDGRLAIPFLWTRDLQWHDESLPYHPNAMTLVAHGHAEELHRNVYYSVGGGFVVDEAQAASGELDSDTTALPYDFNSAGELLALCRLHGLRISELMMENEKAWRSEAEVRAELWRIWEAM